MRNFFDAVWWWIRLAGLLVVAVYLISLIALNAGEQPRLWYWYGRADAPVSIVSLVLVSFLSGGVVFTTGWAMFKAMLKYRRTRAERRDRAERERRQDIERKASMLRTKPAPQPTIRKPPAAVATPRAPLVASGPMPIEPSPREAETRAVALVVPASPIVPVEVYDDAPAVPLATEPIEVDEPSTPPPPAVG